MKNRTVNLGMIGVFTLLLIALLFLALPNTAYASGKITLTFDESTVDPIFEPAGSVQKYEMMQIWHSSTGEWRSDGMSPVPDSAIDGDLTRLEYEFITNANGRNSTITYPEAVRTALAEGKNVTIVAKSYRAGMTIDQLLNYTLTEPEKYTIIQGPSSMQVKLWPMFNYEVGALGGPRLYSHYGHAMTTDVPFVYWNAGQNGYSLYRPTGGRPYSEWAAYTTYGQKQSDGFKVIEPTMITGNGNLNPGFTIDTRVSGVSREFQSENLRIGDGTFLGAGALGLSFHYPIEYFFYIERDSVSEFIVTDLELVDPDTGRVVSSFERTYDPLNPFDVSKHVLNRTSVRAQGSPSLLKDKTYKVRATYQFVSFAQGNFDTSNPASMTPAQAAITTGITPNDINRMYSYDGNALVDGVFDATGTELSNNKAAVALRNLEKATFEWDYMVPNTTNSYVKIGVKVPDRFASMNKTTADDWAVVYGSVEPIDIGMNPAPRMYDDSGTQITKYKPGDRVRIVFPVDHESGNEVIGLNPVTNPKVIINTDIKDSTGGNLSTQRLQTPSLLNPDQTLDMPTTELFVTPDKYFEACATIDPVHGTLGFNEVPGNDEVCVRFYADSSDIGMASPVELLRGGTPQTYLDPRYSYQARFKVKHFAGNETVGLDAATNPRVRINITVTDSEGTEFLNQTVQAASVLNPGGTITMPVSSLFSGASGNIMVCATIDPIHEPLGYNSDPTNDTICEQFNMVKNYAIRDVEVQPQADSFSRGQTRLLTPIDVSFTLANESRADAGNLSSSPLVYIYYRGSRVWTGNVSVGQNSVTTMNVNLGSRYIYRGDNEIRVIVNPNRTTVEYVPGVADPYLDNVGTQNIRVKEYQDCIDCIDVRSRNDWTERFNFSYQEGTVVDRDFNYCLDWDRERRCRDTDGDGVDDYCYWRRYCDRYDYDVPYEACSVNVRASWTQDRAYWETYAFKNVFFRSKWSEDNAGGWIDIKGGTGKIKAGYGFELRITTEYRTNRNILPTADRYAVGSNPYERDRYTGDRYGVHSSGYCDYLRRSPGTTTTNQPTQIYMIMPYTDNSGANVCYILSRTSSSGPWYNNTASFELPLRSSYGLEDERKIYINDDARPGFYRIDIRTPQWYGYSPSRMVSPSDKRLMQDCESFRIEVLKQDDIHSHIIQ